MNLNQFFTIISFFAWWVYVYIFFYFYSYFFFAVYGVRLAVNKDPVAALRGFPSVAARMRPGTRTNRILRDCRRTHGTLHLHLRPYLKPYSYPF